MHSLILATTTRFLMPLLLLFSVFLLLRGHNEPGGGFVGGLVAGASFTLYTLATNVPAARRALRIEAHALVGAGLLLALGSGLVGLLFGDPFLTAGWATIRLPILGVLELGTPLLFDVGVYVVVIGVMSMIVLTLADEE